MISSASDVRSVLLYGIDPEKEQHLSKLKIAIIKGQYLSHSDRTHILVGKRLAELLQVDTGDRIVITTSQADSGDLSQEMFRIGGIFSFGNKKMDTGMAFLPLEAIQKMLQIGSRVHEIALRFQNIHNGLVAEQINHAEPLS
jgi:ABC-type lipoprotein release transport system permease subunit